MKKCSKVINIWCYRLKDWDEGKTLVRLHKSSPSLAIMATFKIHGETSISAWMCFIITEVHCQSTKMLTNNVYNVRLATDRCVHTVDKKRRNGGFLK